MIDNKARSEGSHRRPVRLVAGRKGNQDGINPKVIMRLEITTSAI
jgi:hypothetical protein